MKILFKNKTKYTKEAYDTFLAFHQKKYGMRYKINTFIVIILLLFCLMLNIKFGYIITAFLFLIILACFFLYRFYSPIKKIEKESNSEKIKKEKEFTFTFYDSYMHLVGNNINHKLKYWKLRKAFEDKYYIYLYIDKKYAFILKKDGFSIGNYEEFMQFIKKKIIFKI